MSKILVLGSSSKFRSALAENESEIVFTDDPPQFLKHLAGWDANGSTLQSKTPFDSAFISFDPNESDSPNSNLVRNLACTHSILDQMPLGLSILDRESNLIWANQPMLDWFNIETIEHQNFYDALGGPEIKGPEVHPLITAVSRRMHTTTTISQDDRYFRLQVAPIINDDDVVEFLVVTLTDVSDTTKQRLKMQALHEAELALANLTTQEIFDMDIEERIELLKQNILHYTQDLLNFDVIEIRMLDPKTGLLEPLLSVGIDSEVSKQPLYASAEGNGVTGFVVATGHSYLCEDTTHDPLYLDGLVGAKSSLTVPLIFNDEIIGSFNVESPDVNTFTDSDLEFLESFARGVASAVNTLELLVAQRTNAAHQSVEAIHSAVAIPIDKILVDVAQVMESYIGHDSDVTTRLQRVLRNARDIKASIQKVGESFAPQDELPGGVKTAKRDSLRGKRILVIDADELVRTSAHELLERQGCIVETAHLGHEAISMIKNTDADHAYNAIIADIRLEDISGYELLMKLKELLTNPPLILMTGFGYDPGHSIVKARQAGLRAGAILYKPFRLDQLIETVDQTIQSSENSEPDSQ
ncbi:MAG: response regulator [Pirellulaceae bacterium]